MFSAALAAKASGILIPLFLLPRPRVAMLWLGTGISSAANLLTGKGYIAGGVQTGVAFGFMGIGISYADPWLYVIWIHRVCIARIYNR